MTSASDLKSVTDGQSSKSKFNNPYIYQRTNTSKDLHANASESHLRDGPVLKNNFMNAQSKLRIRSRDNSEPQAIGQRDFRRQSTSISTTLKSRDFSSGVNKMRNSVNSISQRHQSICDTRRPIRTNIGAGVLNTEKSGSNSMSRPGNRVRDIREATTIQEVREIMN